MVTTQFKGRLQCVFIALVAYLSPAFVVAQTNTAETEPDDYWILGAYRQRANAEAEQVRLSALLDRRVFLYRVDNHDVWRVSVSTRGLTESDVQTLGIDYWRTRLNMASIEALPSYRKFGEPPAAPPRPAWLREGETIVAWCERMNANAVGEMRCDKQDLDRLRLLTETVAAQSALLRVRCAQADSLAEREICDAWQNGRSVQNGVQ